MYSITLLETSPIIVGGQQTAADTGTGTEVAADQEVQAQQGGQAAGGVMSIFSMVLMWGAMFAVLYFIIIRPQRKRDKQAREMQEAIRPGDNVITSSGFYGKVTDIGEDSFIVEFGTNRGIRVPVRKSDVAGVKTPKLTPPPAKQG